MADFSNTKSIYLQIVEIIQKRIISGQYIENGRIPSVRELAAELTVNPNTCVRAYEILSRDNIIINKRGVGYFVTLGSKSVILKQKKDYFLQKEIPKIFSEMEILNISLDEFTKMFMTFQKQKNE